MKKTVSMKLMAALVMLLAPLLMGATEHITYTATYGGSPTLGTRTLGGVTYTTVKYGDLYNIGSPGNPSLPVDYIMFSVPCNAKNFSITATPVTGDPIAIDYPILPIQASVLQVTTPDNTIYNSNAYPSTVASFVDDGMIAGENHVVKVAIIPFICECSNSGISLLPINSVNLTLFYDVSDDLPIRPIIRRLSDSREEGYEITETMVVNPEDVRSNCALRLLPQLLASFPMSPRDVAPTHYDYLIITKPEFLKPLRRLVALKNQKGMNVKIVTIDEALDELDSYPPLPDANYIADECNDLRQYLRQHYVNNGTNYVLLAGTEVPYNSTYNGQSDYLYSDLNEEGTGRLSYGAMYVGRLLGHDPQEFDNYTEKLMRYELNPGNSDNIYLQNALFIETFECASYGLSNHGHFPYCTELTAATYPSEYSGNDVIEMIENNPYGFMSTFNMAYPSVSRIYYDYSTETSHYLWALDTARVATYIYDSEVGNGLNRMNNKLYPMIYMSGWGQTMPYVTVPGYNVSYNLGESFTMGKDYGGPAYFGYTKETDVYNASILADRLFNYLLNADALGRAEIYTKWHLDSRYQEDVILHHGLLGDPAIRMWTSIPQQYSNITVNRTDNGITISGIDTNRTTVAYHSNDGSTGCVLTDSPSVTFTDASPNSTIMLFRNTHIPYIAPLVLQNTTLENSQYVIASDVTAGKSVDSGRTNGDVTVAEGIEYEIEASGKVTLAGGFNGEKGALFSVHKSTFK